MKPPTIKLNEYFWIKYIQVPYGDRYYVVMEGHRECCKIPRGETEFLWYVMRGFYSRLGMMESRNLAQRFESFEKRVKEKDRFLDKD